MTTPDFVLELREKIGHAELWLPGTTAIVLRALDPDSGEAVSPPRGWSRTINDCTAVEVLCVKRADTGAWTPVTGIVDPREEPGIAAVRETEEEAAVSARVDRLISIDVVGPITCENGDVSSYLDTAFVLEWNEGEPEPSDGENTEAVFLRANALPEMNKRFQRLIAKALSGSVIADFED
ncbi:NUDIX hydrolase [Schaalia cardiffensis]